MDFDEAYYLREKVAQLAADGILTPEGTAFTTAGLRSYLLGLGLTPEEHCRQYGRLEGLDPNPYFDQDVYLAAKLDQLRSLDERDGRGEIYTLDSLRQCFAEAGLSPLEHYCRFGAYEKDASGAFLDPSEAFDLNAYLDSLPPRERDALLDEARASGLTPVDLYARTAPTIAGVPDVVQRVPAGLAVSLADIAVADADDEALSVSLVAGNGDIGGLQDMNPETPGVQLHGTAEAINAALADLVFTARSGGASSLEIAVSDGKAEDRATYCFSSPWKLQGAFGNERYTLLQNADAERPWTDPAIVDAEKSAASTRDDMSCWAAPAANMLVWSGWAEEGGFGFALEATAEDLVFDAYIQNFLYGDERGGHPLYGLQWFFNGRYFPSAPFLQQGWDQPVAGSGDYIGASVAPYQQLWFLDNTSDVASLVDWSLSLGMPLALGLDWYKAGSLQHLGGHALTCWGYTYDPAYAVTDFRYLTGLIVSDSDDAIGPDARSAPDTLVRLAVAHNAMLGYYVTDHGDVFGLLTEAVFLGPNSMRHDPHAYDYRIPLPLSTGFEAAAPEISLLGIAPDTVMESA